MRSELTQQLAQTPRNGGEQVLAQAREGRQRPCGRPQLHRKRGRRRKRQALGRCKQVYTNAQNDTGKALPVGGQRTRHQLAEDTSELLTPAEEVVGPLESERQGRPDVGRLDGAIKTTLS